MSKGWGLGCTTPYGGRLTMGKRKALATLALVLTAGVDLLGPVRQAMAAEPNTRLVKTIRVGKGPTAILVNPLTDRVYVANTSENSITVISEASQTVVNRIVTRNAPGFHVVGMDVVANKMYFPNNGDLSLSIIDGRDDAYSFRGGMIGHPETVAYDPKRDEVLITNGGAYVTTWSPGTGEFDPKGIHSDTFNHHLAINPRTDLLFVSRTDPSRITTIDLDTRRRLREIPATGHLAIDESADTLYAAEFDGRWLASFNASTGQAFDRVSVGQGGHTVALNLNTGCVYVAGTDGYLHVYDGDRRLMIGRFRVGISMHNIAVSLKSGAIYVVHKDTNQVSVLEDSSCTARSVVVPSPTNASTLAPTGSPTVFVEPSPTLLSSATPGPTRPPFASVTIPPPSPTRTATPSTTADLIGTAVAGTLTARAPMPTRTRTPSGTPTAKATFTPSLTPTPTRTPDRFATSVALTLTALAPPPTPRAVFLPYLVNRAIVNTPPPAHSPTPNPTSVRCADAEAEPNDEPAQALGHPALCEARVVDGAIAGAGAQDGADYYTMLLDRPLRVQVSMTDIALQGTTEVDLGLWTCATGGCSKVGWSGQRDSAPELIDVSLAAGTYFVGAHPSGALGSRAGYRLGWRVVP